MSKIIEIKHIFKILEVNRIRAIRTNDFIRVQVFEDNESVGVFWQTPDLMKKNIKQFGENSYLNLREYKSLIKRKKVNK